MKITEQEAVLLARLLGHHFTGAAIGDENRAITALYNRLNDFCDFCGHRDYPPLQLELAEHSIYRDRIMLTVKPEEVVDAG